MKKKTCKACRNEIDLKKKGLLDLEKKMERTNQRSISCQECVICFFFISSLLCFVFVAVVFFFFLDQM